MAAPVTPLSVLIAEGYTSAHDIKRSDFMSELSAGVKDRETDQIWYTTLQVRSTI